MRKLSVKIIVSVGLILFVTEGIRTYVPIRTYRRRLINKKVSAVALQSNIIKDSLISAMVKNRRDEVQRIVEFVQKEEGIEKIRVFDKEGKIIIAADKKRIGEVVDKKAEACYRCHGEGERRVFLKVNDRARFFQTEEGKKVIGLMTPIYNETDCYPCHDPQKRVLGVLDIMVSLASMEEGISGHTKEMLMSSLLTLALISLAIAILILVLVNRPIQKLVKTMSLVEKGDLTARVNIKSGDELENLGRSFNSMTASLQDTQAQLVQSGKLAAIGELGAGVAHELNNPVAGILGYAQYALEKVRQADFKPKDFKTCEKYLGYIEKEAGRCKTIVENLLKFSRRSPEKFELLDINQVIEDTLAIISHQLMMKKIKWQKELASDLKPVEGNANQLQQVFINIILNAQQAMPEGGTLTIATHLSARTGHREPDTVEIIFRDIGCGIPPEKQDKIFNPFFTTKTDGKGTGLGLSVSYEIIRNHKGRIEVKSEVGEGTIFIVYLPVKAG